MKRAKKAKWRGNSLSLGAKVLITILMIVMTITFLYPLYYLVINSFKTSTEYYVSQFALPTAFDLENYKVMLLDFQFMRYFLNSMIVSCASTALVVSLSVVASYAFAKVRFAFRGAAYILILSTMFLPSQATLIPQYVMFSRYHLINNFASVILAYVASGIPGAILLLRAAFVGIPDDLIESAKIDGAGYVRTLVHIAVPVTMAAISIQIIFNFIAFWNDLLTPMLLLTDGNKQTVMVVLSGLMSRYGNAPTRQLTGLLMSVLPVLILYLFLQKFIMKGMLVGAVKG